MAESAEPLFVGLDLSTQALKASLLDVHLHGVDEVHVRFDEHLPEFGTKGGVLPAGHPLLEGVPDAFAAPVTMYVAAMDRLWDAIVHEHHWPVHRIAAISSAGQQHASVYFAHAARSALERAHGGAPLREQLGADTFSRALVPNWQDASTLAECDELMRFADRTWGPGGDVPPLARVTGSIAHTRFTAAQIMRWRKQHPEEYRNTSRIALVSNFVTTLLTAGGNAEVAPLDESDACGMNLWDMGAADPDWNAALLRLVSGEAQAHGASDGPGAELGGAAELRQKLGAIGTDPTQVVARAGRWLTERYGVPAACLVCFATGDNPATLQCITPRHGEAIVSLGTSDTVLVPSNRYAPSNQYHVFEHPASLEHAGEQVSSAARTPHYFLMLVYKNGSLAREWVRDTYFGGAWDAFDRALRAAAADPPSKHGLGFYWLKPEIIPWDARGVHRYTHDGARWARLDGEFPDAQENALAMVQSQFMAFRTRVGEILRADGRGQHLSRAYVVGGAARNAALCQMLADVLGCEIARPVVRGRAAESDAPVEYNFCSVGAAYRARWAWECTQRRERGEKGIPAFEDVVASAQAQQGAAHETHEVVATPDAAQVRKYDALAAEWAALEGEASARR